MQGLNQVNTVGFFYFDPYQLPKILYLYLVNLYIRCNNFALVITSEHCVNLAWKHRKEYDREEQWGFKGW